MHATRLFAHCIVWCAAAATPLLAQQQPSPDIRLRLAHADSAFQQGAFQKAADDYRAVVRQNAATDFVWLRLGQSLERLNQDGSATVAYANAAKSPTLQLAAEIGLTRIAVRSGKTDVGLDHLRRAAALGVDPMLLDQAPALAPLRSLPEYAAIREIAEDTRYPCRNVHTFDFWVGDFDATLWSLPNGPPGGQLHNTREYDGCVVIEHWIPAPGGSIPGMSMSYYDVNRKAWRFIWNDVSNGSIEFEGELHDGAMRLEAWFPNPDGTKSLARNVLQPVSPDTIHHIFSVSSDSGKTWTVQGEDRFVRRRP